MSQLTHLDEQGNVKMVDVGGKGETERRAVASAFVRMLPETVAALRAQALPKGDALTVAQVAGILGAKRTSDLIPLCHPLRLTQIDVRCSVEDSGVSITAEAATKGPTGVEMEALTAASVAALTIYDMCKAIDRGMVIEGVCLERKSGGASGSYVRGEDG